ncbi:hypothetical protein KKP90_02075 [Methanothermococcus sp. SCGC AD-155-E23]|nr:hypothetical protein [Methanothermococcus sp. SCGC AD-155-E23]
MNIWDIITFKEDEEKFKEVDKFSKDLKRPYRMDNRVKVLGYILTLLVVVSLVHNIL